MATMWVHQGPNSVKNNLMAELILFGEVKHRLDKMTLRLVLGP